MLIRQVTYGGIPLSKLADSGWKAFQHGMQVDEPASLEGSGFENLFTGAALKAMEIIDKHEDDASVHTTTFQELAMDCYKAGCEAAGEPSKWDDKTDHERMAWQGVARHWSNILESEDAPNMMEGWEPFWREWVGKRISPVSVG